MVLGKTMSIEFSYEASENVSRMQAHAFLPHLPASGSGGVSVSPLPLPLDCLLDRRRDDYVHAPIINAAYLMKLQFFGKIIFLLIIVTNSEGWSSKRTQRSRFRRTSKVLTTRKTTENTVIGNKNGKCTGLPKITKANIKGILTRCSGKTEIDGQDFDAAESGISEEETEELFRGKTTVGCKKVKEESFPALIVENNNRLTNFILSPRIVIRHQQIFMSSRNLPTMRIRQNPLLETIGLLKYAFRSSSEKFEILEEGECQFTKEVESFNELKQCRIITGDLTFSKSMEADPPARFRMYKINGCLRINGTNIKNVDFLANTTSDEVTCSSGRHEIHNNKQLCVKKELYNNEKLHFKNNMHPSCEISCNAEPLTKANLKNFQACRSILGDVEIKEWSDPDGVSELIEVFGNVEEIHGQLRLVNTSIKSTSELFRSLRIIDSTVSGGVGIHIEDNPELNLIELRSVESIQSGNQTSVFIRQPKTLITPETSYQLRTSTFGKVEIEAVVRHPEEGGLVVVYVLYFGLLILLNIAMAILLTFLLLNLKKGKKKRKSTLKSKAQNSKFQQQSH
ncbi:hypothetical protein RB195_009249 [Necator americanus]|uniref:Receptor L-domain domain-containing protein n=1 Tax=Necator americanus TaxID=51031 RepID=A0ABR1CTB2_NECAM